MAASRNASRTDLKAKSPRGVLLTESKMMDDEEMSRSRKSSAKSERAVTGNSIIAPMSTIKNEDNEIPEDELDEEESVNDSDYDTDLDMEDSKEEYDPTGRQTYREACSRLGVVPVSNVLKNMTEKELNIKHHGLGANGAKAVAQALMNNTTTNKVNLCDCDIGSVGGGSIAKLLKENYYITELNLARNNLRTNGAEMMSEVITENHTLRVVNLSWNGFRNREAEMLAESVKANRFITRLDLSHNEFPEAGGEFLGPALDANDSLEYFNLSWNHLRGRGAIAIGKGLRANCTLRSFDLSWNGFADEGAAAVGDSLKENNTLIDIDLSNNRITSKGADAVAEGIKVNNTLLILRIGLNPIRNLGASSILNATKNNSDSVLEALHLTNVVVDLETQVVIRDIKEMRPKFQCFCTMSNLSANDKLSDDALTFKEGRRRTVHGIINFLMNYVKERNLRLVDLFNQFDKDKSLSVDKGEFLKGLKAIGIPLDDAQLDSMVEYLDDDGDGEIDYGEFTWLREESG